MAQFLNMYPVELEKGKPAIVSLAQMHQGNANANRVGAIVFQGGQPAALGGSCVGSVIRADGNTVPLIGAISGNEAYVELDANCYAVEGPLQVFVTWVNGTDETTLLAGFGNVQRTSSGAVIQPAEPIPDLPQLLAEIDNMRQATAAAEAAATKAVRYDTAQSLTDAQKDQARGNISAASQQDVEDVKSAFGSALINNGIQNNTYDFLSICKNKTKNINDVNGINFFWNDDGSCTVTGTSTGIARCVIFDNNSSFLGMDLDKSYYLQYKSSNVRCDIFFYVPTGEASIKTYNDKPVVFPSNATGMVILLQVERGKTVNETVNPIIMSSPFTNNFLAEQIINDNSFDYLASVRLRNETNTINGVEWTWSNDGSCHVEGTSTGRTYSIFYDNANAFPEGLEAGKSYRMKYSAPISTVQCITFFYFAETHPESSIKTYSDCVYSIPSDAVGMTIMLQVNTAGVTVDLTVKPKIYGEQLTNTELTEKLEQIDVRAIERSTLFDKTLFDNVDEAIENTFITAGENQKFLMLAWFSDMHRRPFTNPYTDDAFYNTVELIRHLNKRLPLHATLDTGDVIMSGSPYNQSKVAFNVISEYIRSFNDASEFYLYTTGNHDGYDANTVIMQDVEYQMGTHIFNRRIENKPIGKCYYYIDYPDINTRLLVLDIPDSPAVGMTSDQLQWLVSYGLGTVPDGYGVLMAYHIPYVAMRYLETLNNGLGGFTNRISFAGVVNAFHNHTTYSDSVISCDFTGKSNVKVIASLCGHTHFDAVVAPGESFTAYDGVNEPNIGVAITEALPCKEIIIRGAFDYAVDILTYLPEDNEIVLRRIGNGSDRTIAVN